jgi:predicted nucleic acid-binding protein
VREEWSAALAAGQIATCPLVELEVLFSARDGAEFDRLATDIAQLRNIPVTRSVTNAARQAFRELSHTGPGRHRATTIPDLLIAGCAQDAAIGVLHYDRHFDTLASVLDFESRWIAPPGSLD